jgi:zinc transport system ATP-binding protein
MFTDTSTVAGAAAPGAQAPVIEVRDVSFSYDGSFVLEDIDLIVEPKDFVAIIGPNGGGKTTLLKLMIGMYKPARGTVRVLGRPPQEVRSRIGYMPQHLMFDTSFPVSVTDVVLMGCLGRTRAIGPYSRACKEAAREALEKVGLSDLASRPYSALSGGQRQRTLIARALASRPEILMLDEPTSNLDVQMEHELYEILKRLNDDLTIITVSHDLGFVSSYVKTVVCVKRRATIHPTSALTGTDIKDIYGAGFCAVRHDQAQDGEHDEGDSHA